MDKKSRKKIAPIIITVAIIIFSLAYISLFVTLSVLSHKLIVMSAIAIVVYLGICIGIILALRERIKEINGREEDEALKY